MHLLIAAALVVHGSNPFCAQISRLAEGAQEKPAFASLRAEEFRLALIDRGTCHPNGRSFYCKRSILPPEITEQSTAARIAACLADGRISVEKKGEWEPEKTIVRGSGLVFALEESGTDRSHVGRTLYITVHATADFAAAP